MRTTLIFVLLVLAACTPQPVVRGGMMGMPCHEMQDGTMMGDCDGAGPATLVPGSERAPRAVALAPAFLNVADGDTVTFTASVVEKTIKGVTMPMYAYNGMIPGPILRTTRGSTFTVVFKNEIEQPTTVHWHGLRHDIKDDGVPGVSQDPVAQGATYTYTVTVPDAGIYWYHPHVREDLQQDAGLAGNILVLPDTPDAPVTQEQLLVLDDILLGADGIIPFGVEHANHAIMGRYGNVLLVNGEESYALTVAKGSVVRFYLTDVANVRPFNISFSGARMKLVGSDMGLYERDAFVDGVVIAPAERYIVDVLFDDPGVSELRHVTPFGTRVLGTVTVTDDAADSAARDAFLEERTRPDVSADIDRFRARFGDPADITLVTDIDMGNMMMPMMHGDEHVSIEWEDTMHMMNAMHTTAMTRWILRDKETGEENMDMHLRAKAGDTLRIRIENPEDSMHPMQHPIHLHGQRFLVLSQDGVPNEDLVWKDTVLVPIGSTVELLVDVTNPGEWMLHCHIAEHLEAGMMTTLLVDDREDN